MNKKVVFFLISMCFLPLIIFFGYYFIENITDKRSRKEIYLDMRRPITYESKIDTIYRDRRGHNALTLQAANKKNITTVPPEWENDIFKVGDSIVKTKGSLKIYLYRNKKLDTIFDYNNIYIREN